MFKFIGRGFLVCFLAGSLPLTMASVAGSGQEKGGSPAPEKATVEKLIKQLKSESFKVRQAATKELLERPGVMPALRNALKGDDLDLESRLRIRRVLQELEGRATEQQLQTLLKRIENGQVDEFVDQMAFLGENLDDRCWPALLVLAKKLGATAQKTHKVPFPFLDFPALEKYGLPLNALHITGKPSRLTNPKMKGLTRFMIVAQGPIKTELFGNNIAFVNGDLTCKSISKFKSKPGNFEYKIQELLLFLA